ncbi:rod shape-determining protein MreC [Vulcanibacillus modesticaldus]|uniref:Cell shape-determining protein MreC n=1 Tax=Vulcanibacillus modesticaldus TaxID=337097 RepID=A0A1D2YST0_9BACI|nr:rod shape-determining protein MreC [Vulcanibacillus modesticaldus]OEF98045.1 rod shape-determining protein MreC [Vulcanibacillus modesticaldus]
MVSKLLNNKHLIIILLSLIFLIIIMGITINQRDLTWPEKLIKDTVAWTQNILYKPANVIAGFFEDVHDYRVVFEENKALKNSLDQYIQVLAELNELKEENVRLKEMLDYRQQNSSRYQLTVAKVIARNPDRWNNMLVINKGSKQGIKKNMAVITTKGFIGKVYNVSNFSANVQLITDNEDNSFVFASIQSKPKTYGVVGGYDKVKNELKIEKIDLDANVEPGQLVITSSLGGIFPDGLIIGEVVRVEEDGSGGLTKIAYVRPAADMYHIDEVFVVTEALFGNNQSTATAVPKKEED